MRLVHRPRDSDGGRAQRDLATRVEVAESSLAQARGLMFRSALPPEYALVMPVEGGSLLPFRDGPQRQVVHMLFMRVPIDVLWLLDEEVVAVKRMNPWRSVGVARADTIVELPAGAGTEVEPGDCVTVTDDATE